MVGSYLFIASDLLNLLHACQIEPVLGGTDLLLCRRGDIQLQSAIEEAARLYSAPLLLLFSFQITEESIYGSAASFASSFLAFSSIHL
jgi:hypothetical protein